MKKRNSKILELYKSGKTLEEIGRHFKFSRSRAQQIVVKELKGDILKRIGLGDLTEDEVIMLDVAAKEEIREISNSRKNKEEQKTRERIEKKIDELPYSRFVTVSSYAGALGEKIELLKKYFPKVIDNIIQKQKQLWSRHYSKCRICGTTSVKHQSHGLCENCYFKSDIFKEMQEASRIRNIHKWKKHQKEYSKEYSKRPEVIAKIKLREDIKKFGGNREKVMKRDQYRCQKCGRSKENSLQKLGRDLYVYHIGDTKDNRLENLITLCQKCFNEKSVRLMRKSLIP